MQNKTVLRVGVYNNFNFTEEELSAVRKFESEFLPFVNSNSFVNITADFPSIITINPYLSSWQKPCGDLANVKACRVKWVEGANADVHIAQMEAITWSLKQSIPVLLTFMRFVSHASMDRFVTPSCQYRYKYEKAYYRLGSTDKVDVVRRISDYAKSIGSSAELVTACDLYGEGCPSCRNCIKLTYGDSIDADATDVAALSLSCSGDGGKCLFHCPDCWARRLGKISKFRYDEVTVNKKQKGK